MPGIKVLIKGLNKVIDFPANTAMPDIEKHIKGNWSSVEEMSGLPMDTASRMERAKYMGFDPDTKLFRGSLNDESVAVDFTHLSEKPSVANSFSADPKVWEDIGIDLKDVDSSFYEGANTSKNIANRGNIATSDDLKRIAPNYKTRDEAYRKLKDSGFDSYSDPYETVIFDPKNIRSTNAAFNPANKESANLLAGGAAAAVGLTMMAPEEVEASFLGQGAKKAAKDMLGMANKMENAGVHADEIWQKTGWGKGADNKWRFEVDDSMAKAKPLDETSVSNPAYSDWVEEMGARDKGIPLSQGFESPNVTEAYPELARTRLKPVPESASYQGSYSPSSRTLEVKDPFDYPSDTPIESVASHELQHGVQEIEGFAKGGSPDSVAPGYDKWKENAKYFKNEIAEAQAKMRKDPRYVRAEMATGRAKAKNDPEAMKAAFLQKRELEADYPEIAANEAELARALEYTKYTPQEQYKRLAGETEARNVQTRLKMTPEERRATPPWKTEDVPRGDQIVKYGGAGASLSALAALTPEQAQAQTAAQKSFIDSILSDKSLESLPSFTTATGPNIDQQSLPSHLRAGTGGIEGPNQSVPSFVHEAGGLLNKLEVPVLGNPLEGVADYLGNFGYNDSATERLKRAASAGLDLI